MTEGDAIPHLKNKYGVILAYEMYSLGNASDHDVSVCLNEEGYRTTGNWGENPLKMIRCVRCYKIASIWVKHSTKVIGFLEDMKP